MTEKLDTKAESKGSGSGPCYAVEAKAHLFADVATSGQIIERVWTRVNFIKGSVGIPDESFHAKYCGLPSGFYGYEAAMALAWWFVSANVWKFTVRLKVFNFEYSHSCMPTEEYVEIDTRPCFTQIKGV
jgi:hypothetical protein